MKMVLNQKYILKTQRTKITDVRTKNVTRNEMDNYAHKMVRMKCVFLSNHRQNVH